jgi:hypothetical protein
MNMPNKAIFLLIISFFAILEQSHAQNISIVGKVLDIKGNPVVSASVKVLNGSQGTSSDTLGIFRIRLKRNDSILISAIGYGDTSFSIGNRTHWVIVLPPKAKALTEVVVSGVNPNAGLPSDQEITREQIIAATFDDYLKSAMFSNGSYISGVTSGNSFSRIQLNGFGPLNTLNSGVMLPIVPHKEDTKGSRYLLNRFVTGIIVDQNNHILSDSTKLLNYDKIDGQLMIAQDAKNYLTVDKDKVVAFAFKTGDSTYIFLNVPTLNNTDYFLLIALGSKYSAYKLIKTKFTTSTYKNSGLVETGNNYDEYVDQQTYYYVDQKNNKGGSFELKKKSIKMAFQSEKDKTDDFFSLHKNERLNDSFIKNLILYLNQ